MKGIKILLLAMAFSVKLFSQEPDFQYKMDSIILESNLLYSYEKAVWNSTDLLMTNKDLKNKYGGYIVQHSNDSIIVTYFNNTLDKSIARYYYTFQNLNNPYNVSKETSSFSNTEQELLDIKIKIIKQLANTKYEIKIPEGYSPNLVLIKKAEEFNLYILMGTSMPGVIPFGNDYLFKTDLNGTINSWKKFHSRIIPTTSKLPNGEKVISVIHSHLKTTPYITATDICTFRLYGELCDMEEFTVLCTATGKYYKYNLKKNKIEISEPK